MYIQFSLSIFSAKRIKYFRFLVSPSNTGEKMLKGFLQKKKKKMTVFQPPKFRDVRWLKGFNKISDKQILLKEYTVRSRNHKKKN